MMGKSSLPPGFRFHPTDVELVMYHLKRKVMGKKFYFQAIADVDIYKYAPWDLPERSCLRTGDLKWYFFCSRENKYASGERTKRSTDLGYWKTTGRDKPVLYNKVVVGIRRTLVFYRGKAPKGDRTDWVIHEYRLKVKELADKGIAQDAYVLCALFRKDGLGPKNGAEYGAPFKEEDWDDDDEEEAVNGGEVVSSAALSVPALANQNCSVPTTSESLPSAYNPLPMISDNDVACANSPQIVLEDDDVLAMLAMFSEESELPNANDNSEKIDNFNPGGTGEADPSLDGIDIYRDLGDLVNLTGLDEPGDNATMGQMLQGDNSSFLELRDLDVPLNCSPEMRFDHNWQF